jgi:methylthioribulose-1-phosphate dehydratase
MQTDFHNIAAQLIDAGRALHALGMVPATSGNFSARMKDGNIAITVSGAHKGRLTEADIMIVKPDGTPLDGRKPSAEAGLHVQLYQRFPRVNAVLHPHSMSATLTAGQDRDEIVLEGFELLKAFEGIDTHESRMVVPIFENDQTIPRLTKVVNDYMENNGAIMAYIIRGHGFYTWAGSVETALRHCEALEFLLQCEFKSAGLTR